MKPLKLSGLIIALLTCASGTASSASNKHEFLAKLRSADPDGFNILTDINRHFSSKCGYSLSSEKIYTEAEYYAFLRAFSTVQGGRNQVYFKALEGLQCDSPNSSQMRASVEGYLQEFSNQLRSRD